MEALRYYRRATDTYKLDIVFDETVDAITRDGGRHSSSRSKTSGRSGRTARGADHRARDRRLRLPNTIGVPGEDLPHVSHYFTAPHPFYRKRVVIVGGKNSAAEAALDLFRAGAARHDRPPPRGARRLDQVLGQARHREPDQGRLDRRAVRHRLVEITPTHVIVERDGVRDEIPADGVFLLTGYISDNRLLRAAGVEIDPETCGPSHDPETYETNVKAST